MKLTIGENIRNYRKKNDLTQEALADRLCVTYQSVSRWEKGATYPDLELLPAISEILGITVDELIGMPTIEKEKRAKETFDELRRECMKKDYDADHIVEVIRDIRRNYMNTDEAWRPWVQGNDRAFRDPKILPEVRLMAEEYLKIHPMNPHAIETLAVVEDEEHLEEFLERFTAPFDCSERALMFRRYRSRGDVEKFELERNYQLYDAFSILLCPGYLVNWKAGKEKWDAANDFMEKMLAVIRADAEDERPDMWVQDRLELGLKSAKCLAASGKLDEAMQRIEEAVRLLENTMKITDEVVLPTSCSFLEGMKWTAKEDWHSQNNSPDAPKERMIYISTKMNNMSTCYCVYPSDSLDTLKGKSFDPLREREDFSALCERVEALIVTRAQE